MLSPICTHFSDGLIERKDKICAPLSTASEQEKRQAQGTYSRIHQLKAGEGGSAHAAWDATHPGNLRNRQQTHLAEAPHRWFHTPDLLHRQPPPLLWHPPSPSQYSIHLAHLSVFRLFSTVCHAQPPGFLPGNSLFLSLCFVDSQLIRVECKVLSGQEYFLCIFVISQKTLPCEKHTTFQPHS